MVEFNNSWDHTKPEEKVLIAEMFKNYKKKNFFQKILLGGHIKQADWAIEHHKPDYVDKSIHDLQHYLYTDKEVQLDHKTYQDKITILQRLLEHARLLKDG